MEPLPILILCGALLLLPAIYILVQYNGLVSLRNHIAEAWSNVDTELKRRYDLIPNLVAAVKGYAAHERDVLERVTELREVFATLLALASARPGASTTNA